MVTRLSFMTTGEGNKYCSTSLKSTKCLVATVAALPLTDRRGLGQLEVLRARGYKDLTDLSRLEFIIIIITSMFLPSSIHV